MIALQKPIDHFAFPQSIHFHPSHRRNPSAPVVVRATHTPGLLSLSKHSQPTVPRPQQVLAQSRPQKLSPKGKFTRPPTQQPRPVVDSKKSSLPKQQADENKVPSIVPTPEKPSRGRQSSKPATQDKADPRSISSRSQQRRRPNQPFSSSVTIPNKSDPALEAPLNSRPLRNSDSRSNSSDPFVVPPSSANSVESSKQTGTNSGPKPLAFRPPPPLANRPTGKLARRRQPPSVDLVGFTIPSVTPTKAPSVARNYASLGSRRSVPRRASSSIPLTSWDFPICDDSDDNTPPSTPVRESASVPLKKTAATWQQKALFDEPLRTAPASSTFSYPFTSTPSPSPTPAQRRRHHRVPSEGVFAMSTDEESSDTSDDSAAANSLKRRSPSATRRTPSPTPDLSTSATPGFYAGSVFQNSPSPDELPVPAFMA